MWKFLVLYIISFCIAYREVRVMYSEGGKWENLSVDGDELFLVIFPILNTFYGICSWIERQGSIERNLDKFFRIKRSE